MKLCLVVSIALVAGCGDDPPSENAASTAAASTGAAGGGGSGGGAGGGGAGGEPVCGSGNRALPDGLIEIVWDDGVPSTHMREQMFEITVNNQKLTLNEEVLHESARFDLEHPAKVHGFSVQWAAIPPGADPKLELEAGLYPDFGHNGFDFWAEDPYWTGTRCAEDVKDGEWTTYVFDRPIEIVHPGLVYVAHRAEPETPVFWFDGTIPGVGDCAAFDECHSAINMPENQKSTFFNGVSFSFQYDFLVRLHVEYTDDLEPEERFFQPQAFSPTAHVSAGDWNADGWDDLVTDGPKLWLNAGDGTFTDATASSGIAAMGIGATGGVFGDYDNDGCLDLFLYAEAYTLADSLLHSNCDGTFTDVTAASGIVDQQTYNPCNDPVNNVHSPSAAAAWLDVDADGLLDLYVANFICWDNYTFYTDTVFHNLGGGTFEDWTATHGFSPFKTASRGAAPADFDRDGDMDLFVNNYVLQANLLFVNDGTGNVVESAKTLGAAGAKSSTNPPYYGHTIGAAWGDLDNDGDFDLISANLAHPRFFDFSNKTEVLIQTAGAFIDISGDWKEPKSAAGLRYQETHSVPALGDFDQDGVLDLAITTVYDGRPADFYWGKGDGTFELDAYHAGITTQNGWGMSVSDFDNDGDPDLFAHVPFTNGLDGARKGHWVQVGVVGNVSANRSAIGSTVEVSAAGTKRIRHVQGGTGKGGQDSLHLHFGLGAATSVEEIRVTFPGGKEVVYAGPFGADQRIWVLEDGATAPGWAPPP